MKLSRAFVAAVGLLAAAACSDLPTSGARAPEAPSRNTSGTVRVEVTAASVLQGGTVQLYATPYDANNNPIWWWGPVTWSSAAPSVASVNSSGVATGNAQGTATVYATIDGVVGSATVTVAGRIYTQYRNFDCYYERGGHIWVSTEVWARDVTEYPNGPTVTGEPYFVESYEYDNGPTAGIGPMWCEYYDGTNW
ncbi:MAG TPA: Ig-like domain-containing protein [Longimicrobiaceae bacterium]